MFLYLLIWAPKVLQNKGVILAKGEFWLEILVIGEWHGDGVDGVKLCPWHAWRLCARLVIFYKHE